MNYCPGGERPQTYEAMMQHKDNRAQIFYEDGIVWPRGDWDEGEEKEGGGGGGETHRQEEEEEREGPADESLPGVRAAGPEHAQ